MCSMAELVLNQIFETLRSNYFNCQVVSPTFTGRTDTAQEERF